MHKACWKISYVLLPASSGMAYFYRASGQGRYIPERHFRLRKKIECNCHVYVCMYVCMHVCMYISARSFFCCKWQLLWNAGLAHDASNVIHKTKTTFYMYKKSKFGLLCAQGWEEMFKSQGTKSKVVTWLSRNSILTNARLVICAVSELMKNPRFESKRNATF
jgi:hypothetical protein